MSEKGAREYSPQELLSQQPNLAELEEIINKYFYSKINEKIDLESPIIAKAVGFLKDSRFPDGSWSKTPSNTGMVIRALLLAGEPVSSVYIFEAIKWFLGKQEDDGSWSHQIWDTAHVIKALMEYKELLKGDEHLAVTREQLEAAVERGIDYILREAGWKDGKWFKETKWLLQTEPSLVLAHSYDVATAILCMIQIGFSEDKFLSDSVRHLIGRLGREISADKGAKLFHWDNNVLNTTIAIEAIVKFLRQYDISSKTKLEHAQRIFQGIDYLISRQTPGFGGWGDTRHTAKVVIGLAKVLALLKEDEDIQKQYSEKHELKIATRIDLGIQELRELQMPNGSWYGRNMATSTAIEAFIISEAERPLSEIRIPLPMVSFNLLINALRGKIDEYAWQIHEYRVKEKRSPIFQQLQRNLEEEKQRNIECASSLKNFRWAMRMLLVLTGGLAITATIFASELGYIAQEYSNPVLVAEGILMIVGYIVLLIMLK